MQLTRVRWSAGVIVHPTRQDVCRRSSTPSIPLRARARLTSVLFDLAPLRTAEPVVVPSQLRVYRTEEFLRELGVSQVHVVI